jgi:hypothetical protein
LGEFNDVDMTRGYPLTETETRPVHSSIADTPTEYNAVDGTVLTAGGSTERRIHVRNVPAEAATRERCSRSRSTDASCVPFMIDVSHC